MDINLKSTAGRSFNVSFDPITVASLLSLATDLGHAAGVRQALLQMQEDVRQEKYASDEYPGVYLGQIVDMHNLLLPKEVPLEKDEVLFGDGLILTKDTLYGPADFAVDAFTQFLNEYKLLQSGAGSERACMDSFWELCELLQLA